MSKHFAILHSSFLLCFEQLLGYISIINYVEIGKYMKAITVSFCAELNRICLRQQ